MKTIFLMTVLAVSLTGCSTFSESFSESRKLLREVNEAAVRMDVAQAKEAKGTVLTIEGAAEYQQAKKDHDAALEALNMELVVEH